MNRIRRTVWQRIPIWKDKYVNLLRIGRLAREVARQAKQSPGEKPVVFFNASTRLDYMSQNGAFSLLTSWGLRLAGVPVTHFVCQRGMSRCMLSERCRPYLNRGRQYRLSWMSPLMIMLMTACGGSFSQNRLICGCWLPSMIL